MKFAYLPPRVLPKSRLRGVHASLAVLATFISLMVVDKAAARTVTFTYVPTQIETAEGKQRALVDFKRTARRACQAGLPPMPTTIGRGCVAELWGAAVDELERRDGARAIAAAGGTPARSRGNAREQGLRP